MSNLPITELAETATPLTATGEAALAGMDANLPLLPPEVTPQHPHADPEAGKIAALPVWRRLLRHVGIDRAVGFTVLARSWSALSGILTITLIARFLSPAEQGFYYVFYSLVALQIIFELGFSVVILQTASHEAAHLTFLPDGRITGPERAHTRLAALLQKAVRWYAVASVLMAGTLVPVGVTFFRHVAARPGSGDVHFVFPWILVVVASSCTFQIDPLFSFLEGCGYVPQVARTRLRQSMLSTAFGWSALIFHHGLYAPGFFILGQAIAGGYFLYTRRALLLPLLRHAGREYRIDWRHEIWPFQWRIAVSWLAGYMASQLFNPILMSYRGPVEAGRMGMSLTVCTALSTLAVSWLNTKASPFGQMIARREFRRLDQIFTRSLAQAAGVATAACIAVWTMIAWLGRHQVHLRGVPINTRLVAALPLGMLFFGTVCNVVVASLAIYLRAHKHEKFMWPSVVAAVYSISLAFIVGRMPTAHGGTWGIAAGYAAGSLVIGLGYGSFTFFKWRRIWHAA